MVSYHYVKNDSHFYMCLRILLFLNDLRNISAHVVEGCDVILGPNALEL